MNRYIQYSQEQVRTFDQNWLTKDAMLGVSQLAQDALGKTITVIGGFVASATSPATLGISLTAGSVYQLAAADSTSFGSLPSDATQIMQQGMGAAQTVILTTAGLTAGQSQWALIEVTFSQVDAIRANDPTGGLLYYYNSSNPAQPFQGPGNDGLTQPTIRQALATINVTYGIAAATGSETPPTPTNGYVPMYLVDLVFGQTTITGGQILTSAPSVGTGVPSNYPYAPFLAGLLNSHHGGTPGQAPKIHLETEVQGTLPYANLPVAFSWDLSSPPLSDVSLNVGQSASITFENVATVPFHIAVVSGFYRILIAVYSNNSTDTNVYLSPNNTTFTNAFSSWTIETVTGALVGFGSPSTNNSFDYFTSSPVGSAFVGTVPISTIFPNNTSSFFLDLVNGPSATDNVNDIGPFIMEILICTRLTAKCLKYTGGITGGPSVGFSIWNDITTPWTSLGILSVTSGNNYSGFARVDRLV